MESLERHEELVRGCSLCFAGGGNTPVVDVAKDVRVLFVARPGVTEVSTGLPFTGPAGKRLEGWFEEGGSLAGGRSTSRPRALLSWQGAWGRGQGAI